VSDDNNLPDAELEEVDENTKKDEIEEEFIEEDDIE
jgi:hypothetical protein